MRLNTTLINPFSHSYRFRFPAGGVVIVCKSIDGQQEIGDIRLKVGFSVK